MSIEWAGSRVLLVGIGNILLSDDGIGVHVIRALESLQRSGQLDPAIALRDGGTIGLALLNELDGCGALIAIDATQMDAAPGTVRAFVGPDMDAQLGGKRRSVHELALADLIGAARLTDRAPARRALVAIQPGSMQWGLAPTDPLLAAIPEACDTVLSLLEDWDYVLG